MTIGSWLADATNQLSAAGIMTARLDCLVILEDITGLPRASVLAHPEQVLTDAQSASLNTFITQRVQHIPLAYIRGRSEFYGRQFQVNAHVLVPRPESESIIDLLLGLPLPAHPRIADIGTGSGCLGITAQLELPAADASLFDIDEDVLTMAHKNAQSLGAEVTTLRNDLLTGIHEPFDVVLANLPYVPDDYPINAAARHEPALALFAGKNGLDEYRRLLSQLSDRPAALTVPYLITESLPEQHDPLAHLAANTGYALSQTQGLAQLFIRR